MLDLRAMRVMCWGFVKLAAQATLVLLPIVLQYVHRVHVSLAEVTTDNSFGTKTYLGQLLLTPIAKRLNIESQDEFLVLVIGRGG
jgi:hypothetical protein